MWSNKKKLPEMGKKKMPDIRKQTNPENYVLSKAAQNEPFQETEPLYNYGNKQQTEGKQKNLRSGSLKIWTNFIAQLHKLISIVHLPSW